MKNILYLILSFIIFLTSLHISAEIVRLERRVTPCNPDATVWMLDDLGDEGCAEYRTRRDSSITELIDGIRWSYTITDNHTAAWVLRETAVSRHTPDSAIEAVPILYGELSEIPVCNHYRLSRAEEGGIYDMIGGELILMVPRRGSLILYGDTVKAVMRSMKWIETDTAGTVSTTRRYRWHTPGRASLPVAVMTRYTLADSSGRHLADDISAYAIAPEELTEAVAESPCVEVNVEVRGDNITVQINGAAAGFPFEADVTDLSGIFYVRALRGLSPEPLNIPCHQLPAGRYVVGVRGEGLDEKIYLNLP